MQANALLRWLNELRSGFVPGQSKRTIQMGKAEQNTSKQTNERIGGVRDRLLPPQSELPTALETRNTNISKHHRPYCR